MDQLKNLSKKQLLTFIALMLIDLEKMGTIEDSYNQEQYIKDTIKNLKQLERKYK
jgi:hypothetical protein